MRAEGAGPPVVCVSPHYDDAVLSCGGTLTRLRAEGRRCIVLTAFAAGPLGRYRPGPVARHYVAQDLACPQVEVTLGRCRRLVRVRRAEDRQACARLGLHRRTLPLPDAIYRGNPPLYPEEADLFGFIHTDDARELEPRLLHLFEAADKTGTLWLFPSGIGRHVDHQILRRVGERLGSGGRAVLFYAELPYASRRGEEKPVALEMVQPPPGWRDLTVDIEDALPRKVEAASAYRSQLAGLAGETNGSLLLPRWESFLGPEELILVLLGQGGGGPAGLRA